MWTSDWTAESEEILRADIAAGKTTEEIAARLGRSRSSIWNKADRLGLSRPGAETAWPAPHEERLRWCIANGWSSGDIAKDLGKSRSAINKKVHRLKITRPPKPQPPPRIIFARARRETPWTVERVAYLKANAPFKSAREIGDHLGVTRNAVIGKLGRLGLSKPTVRSVAGPRKPRTRGTTIMKPKIEIVRPDPVEGDAAKAFGQRSSLVELSENSCKWPIGTPSSADFFFCGAPRSGKEPYCDRHCAVAFKPAYWRGRDPVLQAAE